MATTWNHFVRNSDIGLDKDEGTPLITFRITEVAQKKPGCIEKYESTRGLEKPVFATYKPLTRCPGESEKLVI
jgi:hypothetical protein